MSQSKRKFHISKHVLEENKRKNEARRHNKTISVEKTIKRIKTVKTGCKHKNVTKDGVYTVCTDCGQVLKENYLVHPTKESEKKKVSKDGIFTLYEDNRIKGYFSHLLNKFIYSPEHNDTDTRKVADLRKIASEKGVKYSERMKKDELLEAVNKQSTNSLKVADLRKIASEKGMKYFGRMKKDELIKAIDKQLTTVDN